MLEYQLLSPEDVVEEGFPYRRVWRTLIIEMGILLVVVVGVLIGSRVGVLENRYAPEISTGIALLPVGAFYLLSARRENRVPQPRQGLILIFILSVIVTNGVVEPLVKGVFTPERWLTEAGFFSRITGYMLTVGVLAEFAKYGVVRYTVWPDAFRVRLDGVAYSVPAALGFATVTNVNLIFSEHPTLNAAVIDILVNIYIHIAVGAIMGYFLGELAAGEVSVGWLPLGLLIAAFVSSLFFGFRQIAIVSGLSSRNIGGFVLAIGFTMFILGALAFLIESAEERMAARAGIRRIR